MWKVFPANLHTQIRLGYCNNQSIQPNVFLEWNSNMASCKQSLLGRKPHLWKKFQTVSCFRMLSLSG